MGMGNGDPAIKRIVVGEFIRFHTWVVSAVLAGLFTWVWNTSAQVQSNAIDINRSRDIISQVPKIATDVEVIKERQKNMEHNVEEVNRKLDLLINRNNAPTQPRRPE